MQPDLRWLLAGLGLGASALALVGCDQGSSSTGAAPTATVTAVPIGSDGERIHPPEGKWCATPEVAKSLVILGSPEVDGCMKFLDGARIPKEKELSPEYIDMPRSTYGFYDDIQTKMRRSAINHAPLCCYNWREKTPGGRPLVDRTNDSKAMVAALVQGAPTGDSPLRLASSLHLASSLRLAPPPEGALPRVLQHWGTQAQLEHASVASFARARLELIALGAPRALVRRYAAAAREELQHTALALEVLHALGGRSMSLAAIPLPPAAESPLEPERQAALAALARRTVSEAFEPEAVAALALHNAAQRCACPELKRILTSVAVDERRHARLALDTVLWCLEESNPSVPLRLPRFIDDSAPRLQAPEERAARAYGVISEADWVAARTRCRGPLAGVLAKAAPGAEA
ncbi:MAG: ferritin-like domain-containing protein [Polyangiaceae bacterium]